MPNAAPRPCNHVGCGALVRDGSGYCAAHQSERKRNTFADPARGSRHERGYGSAWDKRRARILARDNGLCVTCLAQGRVETARHVDHIVPKCAGGTDDDRNLQALCVACHRAKTAREGGAKISAAAQDRTGVGTRFFPSQVSRFFF